MADRYLIVNADDLGASPGINRGILEAHRHGVVTSASLMVDQSGAEDAAAATADLPELSLGLHAQLTEEGGQLRIDPGECLAELERQLARFAELTGKQPTHLDSHHNIHIDPRLAPSFVSVARRYGLPLRGQSPARYYSSFYGQWRGGTTALDQVSLDAFKRAAKDLGGGVTELMCHPGYIDEGFVSSYSIEREAEVGTLCDPSLRPYLEEQGVRLISFAELTAACAG